MTLGGKVEMGVPTPNCERPLASPPAPR